jgi:hypothetical protein
MPAKPTNPRIDALVKPLFDKALEDAASNATTIATAKANEAVGVLFCGTGADLPTKATYVGQLFIRTGATSPGLYVSTGTTTPGWKTVSHAS